MSTRDERRARWRADLEQLAKRIHRKLEPWQLDVAAEIFVSRLKPGSITGRGDIWSAAQAAASKVVREMMADGRLNDAGNWPEGSSQWTAYHARYFPGIRPRGGVSLDNMSEFQAKSAERSVPAAGSAPPCVHKEDTMTQPDETPEVEEAAAEEAAAATTEDAGEAEAGEEAAASEE